MKSSSEQKVWWSTRSWCIASLAGFTYYFIRTEHCGLSSVRSSGLRKAGLPFDRLIAGE